MPASAVASETILLVIDKPHVLAEISSILKEDGFNVLSALGPERAIQTSLKYAGTIDLLLTEAMMPVMSGPDLARTLIVQRRTLRVLMMTGYANGELLVLNHGWHMVKGLDVALALREAIRATLRSPLAQPPDEFDTRTHFPNGEEIPQDETRAGENSGVALTGHYCGDEVNEVRLELEHLQERLDGLTSDAQYLPSIPTADVPQE